MARSAGLSGTDRGGASGAKAGDVSGPGSGGLSGAEVAVTIRYWASARAAAGCDSESLSGHDVGDLLAAAAAAHAGLGVILAVSTILLDGRPASASETLPQGATLEVLPPFAGG
jgi:sulfur-carrier protein